MSNATAMVADLVNPDLEMFSVGGEPPSWIRIFYNPMPEPIVTEALDKFSTAMWAITPQEAIEFIPIGIIETQETVFTINPWEIHLWLGYESQPTRKMSCHLGPDAQQDAQIQFH